MNLSEVFREVDTLVKKADELAEACMFSQIDLKLRGRSVPELREQMEQLSAKVFYTPHELIDERYKLRDLLESDGLDETERGRVRTCLKRVEDAIGKIKDAWTEIETWWQVAKTEYEKNEEIKKRDKEIQERDKRVSDLYGKLMEVKEENEGLKAESRSAEREEPAPWWETYKIKSRDRRSLQAEFARLFKRLTKDQNSVKAWKGGDATFDAIRSEILGDLWNKIPEHLRTKVYASRDGTLRDGTFSYASLKRHYQDHLRGTGTGQFDVPHEGDYNDSQDSAE